MKNVGWRGQGKTLEKPFKAVAGPNETFVDEFGRIFVVPEGCEMKQFETTNKGWIVWRDGALRIRDVQ
jgi:hypothetical protein